MSRAGLPMYDHPCLRGMVDAWWQGLARALRAEGVENVPSKLDRSGSRAALWTAPDLILSQTCGYPLMCAFRDHLSLVATPSYDAAGAEDGYYSSLIVVAANSPVTDIVELQGTIAAANSEDSHSGMNALRYLIAPLAHEGRFFQEVRFTGNHANSVALVRSGEADVAAIDCVSHALFAKHEPKTLDGTRVLTQTSAAPALPYVTRHDANPELKRRLRAGLRRAIADASLEEVRAALLIRDFVALPLKSYKRIVDMETKAIESGYPLLA